MSPATRVETHQLAVRARWSFPVDKLPVSVEPLRETGSVTTGKVTEWKSIRRDPGLDEVIASLSQLRAMFLSARLASSEVNWGVGRDSEGGEWDILPLGFRVRELRIGSVEILVGLFGGFATSMGAIATFMALFNRAAISPMKLKTAWRKEELEQARLKVKLARAEAEYARLMRDVPVKPLPLETGSIEDDAQSGSF